MWINTCAGKVQARPSLSWAQALPLCVPKSSLLLSSIRVFPLPRYSIAYFVILAVSGCCISLLFVAFTIQVLGHAMALRGGMRTAPVAPLSMKAGGSDLESMCKQKISSNKAMIFSKSSCPFCLKAKKARKARRWHCFARDSSKT
jgi:hypothetical protein